MKVNIIATASTGNCFLFEDSIIIDIGVPMKQLEGVLDFKEITHILLTHIHGDHFNKTTIRNIIANHKHIKFIFGEWMREPMRLLRVDNFEVIDMNKLYDFDVFKLVGVNAYHDVENCGYRLVFGEHKHFHMTDTSTLEGITALNYDTATVECNYHKETALGIIEEKYERGEFSHLRKALENHLDVADCVSFCVENKIKELIPVHVGSSTMAEVGDYLKDSLVNCRTIK